MIVSEDVLKHKMKSQMFEMQVEIQSHAKKKEKKIEKKGAVSINKSKIQVSSSGKIRGLNFFYLNLEIFSYFFS